MKTLILIPARYASTRFPGKPLAEIGGKPMIQHVVEKAAAIAADLFVATDDERIFNRVRAFGGQAVMTSDSHRTGTDRCYEAYTKIVAERGEAYDLVVNIQGDEPFIRSEQIAQLISFFERPEVQIATLAKRMDSLSDVLDPNKVKVVFSAHQLALYFSRSPIPYCRGKEKEDWLESSRYYKHIGMYAYRSSALKEITALPAGTLEQIESLEQLRWLENGYKIAVGITEYESVSVDTPEDLQVANALIG